MNKSLRGVTVTNSQSCSDATILDNTVAVKSPNTQHKGVAIVQCPIEQRAKWGLSMNTRTFEVISKDC